MKIIFYVQRKPGFPSSFVCIHNPFAELKSTFSLGRGRGFHPHIIVDICGRAVHVTVKWGKVCVHSLCFEQGIKKISSQDKLMLLHPNPQIPNN